jgi:hypothetical protein
MTNPTPAPAPLPPLNENARKALLIATKRWLDACNQTIALDNFKPTGKAN